MDVACRRPWGTSLQMTPRGERVSGGRRYGRGRGIAVDDVASVDVIGGRGHTYSDRERVSLCTRPPGGRGSAAADNAT